ncbi:DUF1680 family protein [Microlunatus panaciterrae]|uniref:DUF1680 family protein n=1 Tax=Microlunatus panaciterrae TaxID=400768 RepID=A0ABS2RK49_9ACTN|nr:beta-L-arabinofuranosidase domain-containing protein [Microlunatus panaciterrae]MBM7798942.1 DUF1680 family protein [Microlunatus panaciterrae]
MSQREVGLWGRLGPGPVQDRWRLNRDYVTSLRPENLLRPYLTEAGLWSYSGSFGTTVGRPDVRGPQTWHWGWESPTSELRGHILGHWLSAASRIGVDDAATAVRVDGVLAELGRCQQANGGEWLGPFPSAFLERAAAGAKVWAPQYTLHKLFMGLLDAHRTGHEQALPLAVAFAGWMERWTARFSRTEMDDLLDVETGGMLEVWADLFGLTGDPLHRQLLERYDRPRFFGPLLAGEDVLTNKHANTQIPEVLGAARAWEVTGDDRWRDIVHAFWRSAVTDRGTYCTGGSTSGEVWQPPHTQSPRLHAVQEHCAVYNMMRLAETLYRWTGEAAYADYWERNLVNGIFAQQHPETGMISYFLPLSAGSAKAWGRPTEDFWCCHGTLMQAHAWYPDAVTHRLAASDTGEGASTDAATLRVTQYLPSTALWEVGGTEVMVTVENDAGHGPIGGQRQTASALEHIQRVDLPRQPVQRPTAETHEVQVRAARVEFTLEIRVPDWVNGEPSVTLNGEPVAVAVSEGFIALRRIWEHDTVRITLPKALTAVELGDRPGTVAFLDGPLVLAGLVDEERTLIGDPKRPDSMLIPDQDRHHSWWTTGTYRTVEQDRGFRFIGIDQVREETYTVYFPVRPGGQIR